MWNLNTFGKDMANSTDEMLTTNNDTCDPGQSQEHIPYDLIDFVLYIQPAIVISFWEFKLASPIDQYEREENQKIKKENKGADEKIKREETEYRVRRTCYFISLNMLFFFLFHCVECTSCSFLNPSVFLGTAITFLNRPACPWISIAFQLPAVPAYTLGCWYATRMAWVLRRRAEKIINESEDHFGTGNQDKDPRNILKELNEKLFYDDWGEKVWKKIAVVMNIMMFIAATLVLLYTHVYISEVKLTLGRWSSHLMRLLSIVFLAMIPYLYVAYACTRVTEELNKMLEKSMEAERHYVYDKVESSEFGHTADKVNMDSIAVQYNDHDHKPESEDVGPVDEVNIDSIGVNCDIPSEWDNIAIRIKTLDQRIQLSERRAQWDRLHQEISKVQDTALYNGILTSAYTTRNGVHWTLLGMIGAVAWEVLDHLNAFEDSIDSDASKERFVVTLFGTLALVAGISAVIFVICWQICGCCGDKMCKEACCSNLKEYPRANICLVAFATLVVWGIIYISFYFEVYKDKDCTMESNPLFP
ncbi:PREDICTED: uncharacterized protein LOC109466650 [Branchiostoma belcheri]|uniref:Uncharacterized protein LOC109466650 n=1 Tax=Branchiostoma belcheri TaxID=7741 RepID=A0A6P4XTE9_BRABE|nr:PREDICTED: uncharacterized protein LOC109466650 [Branchiostoma belcheri]